MLLKGVTIATAIILIYTILPEGTKPNKEGSFYESIKESKIKTSHISNGAAWGDYDNDGNIDIFIAGRPDKLYRNAGNGVFIDEAHIIKRHSSIAAAWGDYDNDGCKDILLIGAGSNPNILYKNDCNGGFVDVTEKSGISKKAYHGKSSISWGDYNNDGYLDVYITNRGYAENGRYIKTSNWLYKNNGDGTFEDVSSSSGAIGLTHCYERLDVDNMNDKDIQQNNYKKSYQSVWFDYNNDNYLDLFIANDNGISVLYKNMGNGTFKDVTLETNLCKTGTGMGIAIGDYNNDGYQDIYVTNEGVNYLWGNKGGKRFEEKAIDLGATDLGIGWGASFLDYDNDGLLDLLFVNGQVEERGEENKMLTKLYKNTGELFEEISDKEGIIRTDYPKLAMAVADYNNDGFEDFIILSDPSGKKIRYELYTNTGNNNNWIQIELIGTKSNKDAVGAKLILVTDNGHYYKQVISGSSFVSQNSLRQTFGLGTNTNIISLEIIWPSGSKTIVDNIEKNKLVKITE